LSQLHALGYRPAASRDAADVLLYNTCSVRQSAEDKAYARIGDAKVIKKQNPDLILGVIGCMAERDGADLVGRFPQIDLMCGPSELDKMPLLIDNAIKTRAPQTALAGHASRRSGTLEAASDNLESLDLSRSMSAAPGASAYVRITRGCNKFCTYCVVPFTRGAEVHRPPDHIVDECRQLADAGVVEITLLGQTVNHYRYDHGAASGPDASAPQIGPGREAFTNQRSRFNVGRRLTRFSDLLKRIHDQVPAIRRLRFVTSFPLDFGEDVMQVMAESPRICNYLHVPAQSGSDRILKKMNRGYTASQYIEFVDRARQIMDDVQIASDFIVGFPTETDADFESTVRLVRRCGFKNSFIFKYSPRPGTVAIDRFVDDVPEEVKRDRNRRLLAVQAEVSAQVHQKQVGRTVEVLVEGVSRKAQKAASSGNVELGWEKPQTVTQLSGRTAGDLIVMFDGTEHQVGKIVPIRIDSARPLALFGSLIEAPAAS
ncbi:MAG: MiaB/RimO family radical SAM methylthiotransferase, partial [Phycisphaeraceae bacterium]|nr:MiaB/RimO family radical SAM methylthiotransferase [Phycisphaeraceae bacterium]